VNKSPCRVWANKMMILRRPKLRLYDPPYNVDIVQVTNYSFLACLPRIKYVFNYLVRQLKTILFQFVNVGFFFYVSTYTQTVLKNLKQIRNILTTLPTTTTTYCRRLASLVYYTLWNYYYVLSRFLYLFLLWVFTLATVHNGCTVYV